MGTNSYRVQSSGVSCFFHFSLLLMYYPELLKGLFPGTRNPPLYNCSHASQNSFQLYPLVGHPENLSRGKGCSRNDSIKVYNSISQQMIKTVFLFRSRKRKKRKWIHSMTDSDALNIMGSVGFPSRVRHFSGNNSAIFSVFFAGTL